MKPKRLFVAALAALPLCALAQQEQARERAGDPTTGEQARLPEWKAAAEHDAKAAAAGGGSSATLPKVGPSQSSAERTADPTADTGRHDAPTGETPPPAPKPADARSAPGCGDRSAC